MADDESECSSVDSDVDSDCSTDDEALGSVSPTSSLRVELTSQR